MARKKATDMAMPMPYKEPTPKQEFDWALERAVEKAVLAHPRTQKLREAIQQRMAKAAGNGGDDVAAGPKKTTKKRR